MLRNRLNVFGSIWALIVGEETFQLLFEKSIE